MIQRILCIHSFTAHGVVGLKPFLSVLGDAVIPVPSLLLTGPGNMPGCRRLDYDFESMLDGALQAAADDGERLVVFVGYLARAGQVETIRALLTRHRAAVSCIVVDPVSGDNGRPYVAPELLAAWPALLAEAAWALPNLTEVELLTNRKGDAAVDAFRERFPALRLVVTGWPAGDGIETRLYDNGESARHRQRRVAGHHNGTGDLFAAVWMREVFLRGAAPAEAMVGAARLVAARLRSG